MLDAARSHTSAILDEAREHLDTLRGKYFSSEEPAVEPKVYLRLTDNWCELSVRFVVRPRGARNIKDAMSRDILAAMRRAKIGVASGTYAIVQVPTLEVKQLN